METFVNSSPGFACLLLPLARICARNEFTCSRSGGERHTTRIVTLIQLSNLLSTIISWLQLHQRVSRTTVMWEIEREKERKKKQLWNPTSGCCSDVGEKHFTSSTSVERLRRYREKRLKSFVLGYSAVLCERLCLAFGFIRKKKKNYARRVLCGDRETCARRRKK